MSPIEKRLQKLEARLFNMTAFGTIGPVNDSSGAQTAQVTVGFETQNERPVVAQWGLAANPPASTNVLVIYQRGDRKKGIVVGTNHPGTRPTGQAPGETTLHNGFGMSIDLATGDVTIKSNGKPFNVNTTGGNVVMDTGGGDVNINAGGGNLNVVADELLLTGSLSVSNGISMTGTLDVTGGPIFVNGISIVVP